MAAPAPRRADLPAGPDRPGALRRRGPAVLLALLLGSASGPLRAQELPDAVVADPLLMVVGDRGLTASGVARERELAVRDPSPVVPLQAHRDTPMEFLRDVAIIRGLAGETAVYRPTPAEVRARLDTMRERSGDREAWDRFLLVHGLDEDRLAALLYSRMVVERYVQRNVGLAARSAGEDRAAYVARFDTWMVAQRRRAVIRTLPALDPP